MRLMLFYDRPERLLDILRRRAPDADIACCTDYESLPRMIAEQKPEVLYTIRFGGTPRYPRQAIVDQPSLRWVSVGGSGTDHLAPWDPKRLTVTNAAGVGAPTMAQYAIAAMLHFTLNLPHFARAQRRRHWDLAGKVGSVDGRTLVILGFGKTGQATARLAKVLGLRVFAIRANPAPTPDVDRVFAASELHAVLPEADFLLVSVPLTPATRGLMDEAAFQRLKPGAALIDVSRGGVVRQTALIDALRSGRLAGAALDVFETEPLPADNPLWGMANVILTPHCASVYDGWDRRSMEMFCDNLDRWRQGLALENVVDPVRGY
jgi:phosphoglycerate dehydrogenase-like enzyme